MSLTIAKGDALPPMGESAAVLSMISRAATDPAIDIDKLERLMQMHERMESRRAETEYAAAMADMQPELPVVGERGKLEGRYTFALWEDINTAIKPVLQRHGFSLTFRMDTANGITVTGVLSHRAGHKEETTITLPADPSGNKPAVQAVASSVSYGKRYTASALLNLTSHGEDDDAYRAHEPLNKWLAVADDLVEYPEYLKQRAALLAEYKTAEKVPKDVQRAFASARSRTEPKD